MKKSVGAQTLVFPTPTWIVGTYDNDGRPNAMAAAWAVCAAQDTVTIGGVELSAGCAFARKEHPGCCSRRPTCPGFASA